MMHCLQCISAIDADDQHYVTGDLGPDIIAVIQQNVGHEVRDDEMLCSPCFEEVMQHITSSNPSVGTSNRSSPQRNEYELENRHDSNVCVWCPNSLFGRRTHSLPMGAERTFISERIFPREIPDGALVCYGCWLYTRRTLQQQGVIRALPDDLNACVWCRRSLARTRRHSIPEGPERNEIIARIYPREIPPGGQVCYACWVSARRNVQHAQNELDARQVPGPFYHHENIVCVWCQTSLYRRRTHVLVNGPERDEVAVRIHPRELPERAFLCGNCWTQTQENIHLIQREVVQQPAVLDPAMTLEDFAHTTHSSERCFVPECGNPERNRVPLYLRKHILKSQKIFVSENARICNLHKSLYNWEFLEQHEFSKTFTKNEMESMLRLSIQDYEKHILDFESLDEIEDNYLKYWTGVTKDNFLNIFHQIRPALTSKRPKTALGVYLMKVRTGDSNERLASLLDMSGTTVVRLLQSAREALLSSFVPLHLGLERISREEVIGRNLLIPEGLFGNREERVPIVICDGTYIYFQKSSNYLFQKKSYSLHKYANLIKPFLIVATDGHILDIFGPYPATESDSDIMSALLRDENGELRNFFEPNDVFILDRGFRDVIPFLEALGYKVHKPESLEEGEIQLPTLKANKSRCVTLCRWVVEVVNGRFKRDYKLFRQDYFNTAATHLMDDLRICAAFINAFHPVIENRPDAEMILRRALRRLNMPNLLADLIITNRINRYRAQFSNIDAQLPALDIFPEMTIADLILFGLGIYQIKQARSYYGEHLRENGSFRVEVSDELEVVARAVPSQTDHLLIRGRIRSRHQSGRKYYTYILISPEGSVWDEKIVSYYCTCIAGKRTVGCCAHTMTIVWYLGWARHQDNISAPASFLDGILVRDDIENEVDE